VGVSQDEPGVVYVLPNLLESWAATLQRAVSLHRDPRVFQLEPCKHDYPAAVAAGDAHHSCGFVVGADPRLLPPLDRVPFGDQYLIIL
jgi:hypothetical protein